MTAVQAAQSDSWGIASRIRRDDELVLATQVLKAGTNETTLSRFADDRWDLAPATFRENVPRSIAAVDFAALHDPLQRLTVKEFLWTRLNEPSPYPTQARMAPTSARAAFARKSLFQIRLWPRARPGECASGSGGAKLVARWTAPHTDQETG